MSSFKPHKIKVFCTWTIVLILKKGFGHQEIQWLLQSDAGQLINLIRIRYYYIIWWYNHVRINSYGIRHFHHFLTIKTFEIPSNTGWLRMWHWPSLPAVLTANNILWILLEFASLNRCLKKGTGSLASPQNCEAAQRGELLAANLAFSWHEGWGRKRKGSRSKTRKIL